MSDDRRKSLIVGNLPEETVAALKDARMPDDAMSDWQLIETAPKDGTKVWCWLYDTGIVLMHWTTAEENAAADGSDDPDEYISCWVVSASPNDDYEPKFWKPFDAIGIPPGVKWTGSRWRDTAEG